MWADNWIPLIFLWDPCFSSKDWGESVTALSPPRERWQWLVLSEPWEEDMLSQAWGQPLEGAGWASSMGFQADITAFDDGVEQGSLIYWFDQCCSFHWRASCSMLMGAGWASEWDCTTVAPVISRAVSSSLGRCILRSLQSGKYFHFPSQASGLPHFKSYSWDRFPAAVTQPVFVAGSDGKPCSCCRLCALSYLGCWALPPSPTACWPSCGPSLGWPWAASPLLYCLWVGMWQLVGVGLYRGTSDRQWVGRDLSTRQGRASRNRSLEIVMCAISLQAAKSTSLLGGPKNYNFLLV